MTVELLLIGLDGATFHVLDPLMAAGVMPNLQRLCAEGVRAPLRTVVPALTPPAWTSLVTGRNPGQHGVFDFFQKESVDSPNIRFVTSQDVRSETIWALANRSGKRAVALNFPVTFPAPPIDGYVIPGWLPWRHLRLGCRPRALYDRLKQLPGFNPKELAMDMALEEKALEGCPPEEYFDWIDMHIRKERTWGEIVEMLLADDPCELVTVVLDGVDKLQHLFWRFLDEDYRHTLQSEWEQQVRARCLDYFRELDGQIGRMLAAAGPQATVLVASDHGFGPQVRTFYVNAWLARQGLLAWADEAAPQPGDAQTLGVGQIARHTYLLDWQQTRAFAPLPSGNGIHILRQSGAHPHGVTDAEYESFRDELIRGLLAVTDPATGEPVVAHAWPREEVFSGPAVEFAPDITLELSDGGLVSILAAEDVVAPREYPSGAHRPQGIFIGRGGALARGEALAELSILQVAPVVLQSLGLAVPDEMEGAVPEGLFVEPVHVNGSGPTRREVLREDVPREDAPREDAPVDAGPVLDAEAEAELFRRLQALGYVE